MGDIMTGIYKITNTINGKCYIGQAVDIKNRWLAHRRRYKNPKSTQYNCRVYRAMRKYGIENFRFEIIKECSVAQLNDLEIFYINQFKSDNKDFGYNLTSGGSHSTPLKIDWETANEIIKQLKTTNDTNQDIARKYGVSEATVRQISYGQMWKKDSEIYPLRAIRKRSKNGVHCERKSQLTETCPVCGKKMYRYSQICNECIKREQLSEAVSNTEEKIKIGKVEFAKLILDKGFSRVGKEYGVSDATIKKWCARIGIPRTKDELQRWYDSCSK